jgi:hypothetical protein
LTFSSIDFSAIKFVRLVLVARGKVRQLPDSPGTASQVNELKRMSINFGAFTLRNFCHSEQSREWSGSGSHDMDGKAEG